MDSLSIGPEIDPNQFGRDVEKVKKWEKEFEKIEHTVDSACKVGLLMTVDSDTINDTLITF